MPFGAHETMEVHEILNGSINMINHFSLYASQCQDHNLRQMIHNHIQTAVEGYDQLVAYTHDYNAANRSMQPYSQPNIQPQQVRYGLHQPQSHVPQTQGQLNDQQIIAGMLCLHKGSAKNHIAASLECADPNVREMLIHGAVNCANQAYEVFLFMNQQGYYQVPTMEDHTAKTYLHSYKPVQQNIYQ
ncbi:spore coat protein [Chengkuizengella sp. SCS-71B]|uniref:spore coat protein n=1 Tax=Chengkuizengella sp. SCS-71B TaxID=3115290 RepID=UPI0032C2427B